MTSYSYDLPPTAVCPSCEAVVVLPAEVDPEIGPPICGTCGSEIPDPRLEATHASATGAPAGSGYEGAAEEEPTENRRYTRSGLLRALSDTVAEKGLAAIARRTPPSLRG